MSSSFRFPALIVLSLILTSLFATSLHAQNFQPFFAPGKEGERASLHLTLQRVFQFDDAFLETISKKAGDPDADRARAELVRELPTAEEFLKRAIENHSYQGLEKLTPSELSIAMKFYEYKFSLRWTVAKPSAGDGMLQMNVDRIDRAVLATDWGPGTEAIGNPRVDFPNPIGFVLKLRPAMKGIPEDDRAVLYAGLLHLVPDYAFDALVPDFLKELNSIAASNSHSLILAQAVRLAFDSPSRGAAILQVARDSEYYNGFSSVLWKAAPLSRSILKTELIARPNLMLKFADREPEVVSAALNRLSGDDVTQLFFANRNAVAALIVRPKIKDLLNSKFFQKIPADLLADVRSRLSESALSNVKHWDYNDPQLSNALNALVAACKCVGRGAAFIRK